MCTVARGESQRHKAQNLDILNSTARVCASDLLILIHDKLVIHSVTWQTVIDATSGIGPTTIITPVFAHS